MSLVVVVALELSFSKSIAQLFIWWIPKMNIYMLQHDLPISLFLIQPLVKHYAKSVEYSNIIARINLHNDSFLVSCFGIGRLIHSLQSIVQQRCFQLLAFV